MVKRNSLFVRILIPVAIVMLFQTLLISIVLFVNGTITSLQTNAIETMRRNAENRAMTLEDRMVYYWSNLDKLEVELTRELDAYINAHPITLDDILTSYQHKTNLLGKMSPALLNSLRVNTSTGVYIVFADDSFRAGRRYNGLYYRDLDPVSNPADNSDLIFMRGFIDIARQEKIQLDNLWSESFALSKNNTAVIDTLNKPYNAFYANPSASAGDLSYWSSPHVLDTNTTKDSRRFVTYTRPLIYDGKVVAIIGTEVQTSQMERLMPAGDFGETGKGGYMLVRYENTNDGGMVCETYLVTGSYIKRFTSTGSKIQLTTTSRDGVYNILNSDEGVEVVLHPIRLYNSSSAFSGDKWAVAAIATDSMLFEPAQNVSRGILYSSVVAIMVGIIVISITLRMSIRPLISIADQISRSGNEYPIIESNSNTYEIELLTSTFNELRVKRSVIDAQLREERERYLVALESAADTFLEYDVSQDSFMLYYFSDGADKQLSSTVLSQFTDKIEAGEICHPEDKQLLLDFVGLLLAEPIEIRAKPSFFSHIQDNILDDGYHWLALKATHLRDDDGEIIKIVGTARVITGDKLDEFMHIETLRRDPVTGLYNRAYGMQKLRAYVAGSLREGREFAAVLMHFDNFDRFEAYYGRFFGETILMQLCRLLLPLLSPDDIAIRMTNDKLLVVLDGAARDELFERASVFIAKLDEMYVGENTELNLRISTGVILHTDVRDCDSMIENLHRAERYSRRMGDEELVLYSDLPDEAKHEEMLIHDTPVAFSFDISKENIVSFAFELFERTSDIPSAVNMSLGVIGSMFELSQVVVFNFDNDFGTDQVVCMWEQDASPYNTSIEKVAQSDLDAFEALLDENGTVAYNSSSCARFSDGLLRMLSIVRGETSSAFCCAIYENGVKTGRVIFKSSESNHAWGDGELHSFYEVTKIMAAHLSIEKSNSASRAKSEFLSRISHEIRTPMNAIIGMTDIARNSMDNMTRLEDSLSKIDFSAKHLLSLINDVLEMSRIESGKLHIEPAPFRLSEFMAGIDTLMRSPIEGRGIRFDIVSDIVMDSVCGDEYRLRQVVVNLLSNAAKFTDQDGVVSFTINQLEPVNDLPRFHFSVKDTGIGIAKEEQPKIFRAFEQAESGTSKRQGTGLGLAISANIIAAMGSKIELVSDLGIGSEFSFTIELEPADTADSAGDGADEVVDYEGFFTGRRVLLAEDNEINVEIATYVLESSGFELEVAEDGVQAVDKFLASAKGYYDAILMDIQMPNMDGLTATRMIRKNAQHPDARTIPIIAMTANAFDDDTKKSIESGMNGHIAKPIDNDKLYSLLRELLSKDR